MGDYIVGIGLAAVVLLIIASLIYGYSQPDPSSWTMDSDEEREYDRRSGL